MGRAPLRPNKEQREPFKLRGVKSERRLYNYNFGSLRKEKNNTEGKRRDRPGRKVDGNPKEFF